MANALWLPLGRPFSLNDLVEANVIFSDKRSLQFAFSLIATRVIFSVYTRCEQKVFLRITSRRKMIIDLSWTSRMRETSCKNFLDKYNADPLFVQMVKRSGELTSVAVEISTAIILTS